MASGYTDQDSFISAAITGASRRIERFCNRSVINAHGGGPTTLTEVHSLDGRRHELRVVEYPVLSTTSVIENDTTLTANADDGYYIDSDDGTYYRVSEIETTGFTHPKSTKPWLRGTNQIQVIYKPGWASASVPKVFEEACIRTAIFYLNSVSTSGQRFVRMGAFSTDSMPGLPRDIKELISPYRLSRMIASEERATTPEPVQQDILAR